MLKTKELIKIAMFISFIILGSFIRISIYPVSITLSFLVINFICLVSGLKTSFLSVLIYIIIGMCGIPVFSQGGGIGYLLNPAFGYLIGFLIITISSNIFKKIDFLGDREFIKNIIISLTNIFVIYICGSLYAWALSNLYIGESIDISYLITFYILIFIPGDLLSILLSSYLSVRLKRIVK